MQEDASSLPSSATKVELEGKTIYIVGTAHVSAQSVQDVRAAVAAVHPDTIAIELCEPRYQGMVKKDAWRHTNLFQVIRQKKATFLLAQMVLQSFYRRLGRCVRLFFGTVFSLVAFADLRRCHWSTKQIHRQQFCPVCRCRPVWF